MDSIENRNTRDKIVSAAIDLYSSKGFAETSLREIANEVGIKVSSIYNHFPSKDAILDVIFDEYSTWIRETSPQNEDIDTLIDKANFENGVTADSLYSAMFFTFPETHSTRYTKMLKILHYEAINNEKINAFMEYETIESSVVFMRNMFNRLIELGYLKPFDASVVSSLLYSVILAYVTLSTMGLNHMDRHGGKKNMHDLIIYVLQLVVDGKA